MYEYIPFLYSVNHNQEHRERYRSGHLDDWIISALSRSFTGKTSRHHHAEVNVHVGAPMSDSQQDLRTWRR